MRKKVQIPRRLFLLQDQEEGHFIPALDDSGGCDDLLAYVSLKAARRGAAHQNKLYDLGCEPVRVK